MTDLPNQMNAFVLMRHGGLDALEFKTDWPMPQAKGPRSFDQSRRLRYEQHRREHALWLVFQKPWTNPRQVKPTPKYPKMIQLGVVRLSPFHVFKAQMFVDRL